MDKAFKDLDDWVTLRDMPNGQKRVIKAALKLFSTQGFDGTSTAQIAEESGMSQATIFKYFKSKNDLLLFIVKPMIEHILPVYGKEFAAQIAGHSNDMAGLIHFIVTNRYQFLVQNKDAVIILINQVLINDDIRNMLLEKLESMQEIFVENIWHTIQATGEVRDDLNMEQFIRLIASQVAFYFLQTQRIMSVTDPKRIDDDLTKIEESIILTIKK